MAGNPTSKTPLLLLKTKSAPVDGYQDYFSTFDGGRYDPIFVPVFDHRFNQTALGDVRHCISSGGFAAGPAQAYGAVIFTSQRAVEAFSQIVDEVRKESSVSIDEFLPATTPLYAVGPATARGLKALGLSCPVLGEESGTGEVLSDFILEHYNSLHSAGTQKPPILFLVGDKRRDIIPKKLQSLDLSPAQRSKVVELVIYETGEMQSFKSEFAALLKQNDARQAKDDWVIVFSPTGCKAMLEILGLLDAESGKVLPNVRPKTTRIATIGPTTRDYLKSEFGFTPDACAEKPSPEGVAAAIQSVT